MFVDVWVRSIMVALISSDIQDHVGTHIILLHIRSKHVDSIIQGIFLRIVFIQWSHIQVKFEEFQWSSGTEHSSFSLINLRCKEPKIVFDVMAPLGVTRGIERIFSHPFSESVKTKISTAHISKTKTNFSKLPSKLFSGLQNLTIEVNLSRRFSWPSNQFHLQSVILSWHHFLKYFNYGAMYPPFQWKHETLEKIPCDLMVSPIDEMF